MNCAGYVIGDRVPNTFYDLKNEITNPGLAKCNLDNKQKLDKQNAPKLNHAINFLKQLAIFYAEPGYGETVANIKFIPYDRQSELYDVYCAKTLREDSPIFPVSVIMAGREVFRQAFLSLKNEIRLRSSKGAFETCSVCNAFHEILKSESSEWSVDKIDLVQKFKRLHLKLQAEERADSERRKSLAKDVLDSEGIMI